MVEMVLEHGNCCSKRYHQMLGNRLCINDTDSKENVSIKGRNDYRQYMKNYKVYHE